MNLMFKTITSNLNHLINTFCQQISVRNINRWKQNASSSARFSFAFNYLRHVMILLFSQCQICVGMLPFRKGPWACSTHVRLQQQNRCKPQPSLSQESFGQLFSFRKYWPGGHCLRQPLYSEIFNNVCLFIINLV